MMPTKPLTPEQKTLSAELSKGLAVALARFAGVVIEDARESGHIADIRRAVINFLTLRFPLVSDIPSLVERAVGRTARGIDVNTRMLVDAIMPTESPLDFQARDAPKLGPATPFARDDRQPPTAREPAVGRPPRRRL